jgi:predicted MFS family arabinose efflux permease
MFIELRASIQVLARLSLGFAIFITGWIGGELADVFKDEREVVFMIALFIPLLSILGVNLNMANRIFAQIANQIIK